MDRRGQTNGIGRVDIDRCWMELRQTSDRSVTNVGWNGDECQMERGKTLDGCRMEWRRMSDGVETDVERKGDKCRTKWGRTSDGTEWTMIAMATTSVMML